MGVFDTEHPDPGDGGTYLGIVTLGKGLVFTDVWSFWKRLNIFVISLQPWSHRLWRFLPQIVFPL